MAATKKFHERTHPLIQVDAEGQSTGELVPEWKSWTNEDLSKATKHQSMIYRWVAAGNKALAAHDAQQDFDGTNEPWEHQDLLDNLVSAREAVATWLRGKGRVNPGGNKFQPVVRDTEQDEEEEPSREKLDKHFYRHYKQLRNAHHWGATLPDDITAVIEHPKGISALSAALIAPLRMAVHREASCQSVREDEYGNPYVDPDASCQHGDNEVRLINRDTRPPNGWVEKSDDRINRDHGRQVMERFGLEEAPKEGESEAESEVRREANEASGKGLVDAAYSLVRDGSLPKAEGDLPENPKELGAHILARVFWGRTQAQNTARRLFGILPDDGDQETVAKAQLGKVLNDFVDWVANPPKGYQSESKLLPLVEGEPNHTLAVNAVQSGFAWDPGKSRLKKGNRLIPVNLGSSGYDDHKMLDAAIKHGVPLPEKLRPMGTSIGDRSARFDAPDLFWDCPHGNDCEPMSNPLATTLPSAGPDKVHTACERQIRSADAHLGAGYATALDTAASSGSWKDLDRAILLRRKIWRSFSKPTGRAPRTDSLSKVQENKFLAQDLLVPGKKWTHWAPAMSEVAGNHSILGVFGKQGSSVLCPWCLPRQEVDRLPYVHPDGADGCDRCKGTGVVPMETDTYHRALARFGKSVDTFKVMGVFKSGPRSRLLRNTVPEPAPAPVPEQPPAEAPARRRSRSAAANKDFGKR